MEKITCTYFSYNPKIYNLGKISTSVVQCRRQSNNQYIIKEKVWIGFYKSKKKNEKSCFQ